MIAFILTAAIAWSAEAPEGVFPYPIHEHALDNGLEVYVVPMNSPGVVAYYSWVGVGSRDEVHEGRTGFAHFFEHLMFKSTETMSADERSERFVRAGTEDNAWTWLDETVYHAVLSIDHLEEHVAMEADRFQHLALTPDDVRKEAGAVYGEFRKSQASPRFRLDKAIWGTAFTAHTYGHDTLGHEADIAAMPQSFEYAQRFFDHYYRPGNVDLVVAGDVQPEAVFALIEDHYAGWEPADEKRPEVPTEPEQTELREVHVAWPSPTGPRLSLAWKIPAADPDDTAVAALQLVEDLLLSPVGPLQRRIVEEEGLAYSVSGWRGDLVDPALFSIEVLAKDAEHFERIEAIVREELATLEQGVDPERLDRTRTHQRYDFLTGLDDPDTVASQLGWFLRRGDSPDAIDRWFATYDAVTAEDISEAVATYFVDSRLTRGTLAPEPAEAEPAEGADPAAETPEGGAQ